MELDYAEVEEEFSAAPAAPSSAAKAAPKPAANTILELQRQREVAIMSRPILQKTPASNLAAVLERTLLHTARETSASSQASAGKERARSGSSDDKEGEKGGEEGGGGLSEDEVANIAKALAGRTPAESTALRAITYVA